MAGGGGGGRAGAGAGDAAAGAGGGGAGGGGAALDAGGGGAALGAGGVWPHAVLHTANVSASTTPQRMSATLAEERPAERVLDAKTTTATPAGGSPGASRRVGRHTLILRNP